MRVCPAGGSRRRFITLTDTEEEEEEEEAKKCLVSALSVLLFSWFVLSCEGGEMCFLFLSFIVHDINIRDVCHVSGIENQHVHTIRSLKMFNIVNMIAFPCMYLFHHYSLSCHLL